MRKTTGLTFERHAELGKELRSIRATLSALLIETSEAYPRTGKHPRNVDRNLGKALNAIGEIRSSLEELCLKDCPEVWTTKIYYGSDDEPITEHRVGEGNLA